MAGVSKKFSLNFKKNAKKRAGEQRDDLEVPLTSVRSLSPSMGSSQQSRVPGGAKSSSLGSIHSELDEELDQEDIMALTHNVRSFSEALQALKHTIAVPDLTTCSERFKIATWDKLGDVLHILRGVLQKYPVLQSTDVLTTAAMLITKIKSYNYDDLGSDGSDLLAAVDQLALAFSSSVSEYLMGDIESYPKISKSKSYDNLHAAAASSSRADTEVMENTEHDRVYERLSGVEMDERLRRLESGTEIAFERAKAWARYSKEIITYVEKRAHLENECSKGLIKLANSVKQTITEDTFLPFQSIYCTALDQDIDFATTYQATSNLLSTVKFVEPLSNRRTEHEKTRKNLRDWWAKETKKMQDSVTNLKKARNAYCSRMLDYEKATDSTLKAESDNLNQSSGSSAATKVEKKKKQEEDALFRSKEAEITFQTCVLEANNSQRELERVKGEILAQIRELIHHSDQIMKAVTTSYFQMLYSVSAAVPLQFQVLAESSGQYDAGGQYMEYIRRLPVSTRYTPPEPFVFQQYSTEHSRSEGGGGGRKPSTHSSGSGSDLVYGDDSPHLSPRSVSVLGVGGVAKEEDDSVSGSSCKSSPSASPYPSHRLLGSSNSSTSMNELLAAAEDRLHHQHGQHGGAAGVSVFRGVSLSRAAQTHVFKKLRMSSRCRQCETYVYFQGAECEKCGLTSHKRCLETLSWECGTGRGGGGGASATGSSAQRRMTTFGVDFSAHVQENHTQIPHLVRMCVAKVDEAGIDLKGIYRVSGVKSKVEKLCQSFETEPAHVDLEDHNPHVVANVLKLYLRQLPEPILTFKLYPALMRMAKENQEQSAPLSDMLPALTPLIHALPAANLRTLSLLMHHLHLVTDHQPANHMSATNLAIVFGPTLLQPSEGAASLDSLMDTPHQTRIVETLIQHVQTIFGEPEFPLPNATQSNRGGRLDVVAETAPSDSNPPPADADGGRGDEREEEDKATSSWFPEITENLLDELAREEPRFQRMDGGGGGGDGDDGPTTFPEHDSRVEMADLPPNNPQGALTPAAADKEDEEGDWDLEDGLLLPDQSNSCCINSPPPHTQLSTIKPLSLTAASVTGGVINNVRSPGLRRKILPSQVLPKAPTHSEGGSSKLTKPLPFTPSQPLRSRTPVSPALSSSSSSPSLRSTEEPQQQPHIIISSSSSSVSSLSSLPSPRRPPSVDGPPRPLEEEEEEEEAEEAHDSAGNVGNNRHPRYV